MICRVEFAANERDFRVRAVEITYSRMREKPKIIRDACGAASVRERTSSDADLPACDASEERCR